MGDIFGNENGSACLYSHIQFAADSQYQRSEAAELLSLFSV